MIGLGRKMESIAEKSEEVLSVFKSTVIKLASINEEAQNQIQGKEAMSRALTSEANDLKSIVKSNQKVIGNIEKLLD
tara:strand:+ start:722 stop:952 length:231 start_codon:yes stop_codon:yes gene_type:complete